MPRATGIFALGLSLLVGCVCEPRGAAPPPPAPSAAPRLHVTIATAPGRDGWVVRYDVDPPTRELRFLRRIKAFRERHWSVATGGVQLVVRGDEEALVGKEPFGHAEVTFPCLSSADGKDYQPCVRFSEGSSLLYTGHLLAVAGGAREGPRAPARFTLVRSDAASTVVVRGQDISAAGAEWEDDSDDGTYVYVGRVQPVTTPRFVAVLDPALPEWLRARTVELVPRLVDLYATRTATPLTLKPVLYMPYHDGGPGAAHAGGTLPGAILLGMEGRAWGKATAALERELAHFLAHELSHLWNRRMYRPAEGPSWMHEGGAEAFALRALLELGVLDRTAFVQRHWEALDECRAAMAGVTLAESEQLENGKSAYRCGLVLGLLTELGTRGSPDIFGFWGRLFERARGSHNEYSEETYLGLLGDDAPALAPFVRALLRGRTADSTEAWAAALRAAGVTVEVAVNDAAPEYQQKWGMGLLRSLMKADCHGEASLKRGPDQVTLEGMPTCAHLTHDVTVTRISGHKILEDGALAYDEAQKSCAAGGSVRVGEPAQGGLPGGEVELPCAGLQRRPLVMHLGPIPSFAPAPR